MVYTQAGLKAHGGKPVRVSVLTNAVPNYRRPVFDAVAKDPGVKLKVFVSLPVDFSDKEAQKSLLLHHSMGVNIRRRSVHSKAGTEQIEWLHIPIMLLLDLLIFRPDLVISGEFGLRSFIAYFASKLRGVPFVLWSEEIKENARSLTWLQRLLRGFLIPKADAFLVWGLPAVKYLKSWKVSDNKIYYCAQAVDNQFWQRRMLLYDRNKLRLELDLHGKVFLAVGRLIARKGFDKLLLAWNLMSISCKQENTLVLVGDGPENKSLRQLAKNLGLSKILFTGSQDSDQLAKWYALADIFVFPSLLDVWGLVVNEAMACGLPVLASKHAGASQELVQNSGVGELFEPNDIVVFSALLERWCTKDVSIKRDQIHAAVERLNFDVSIAAFRRIVTEQTRAGW
jgi:glycosyltransferase involved in cell wall biosynthesis